MVGPDEGEYEVSTEKILSVIDDHASTTALLLLPGLQYYTGQLFELEKITNYAQSKGLIVGVGSCACGWECTSSSDRTRECRFCCVVYLQIHERWPGAIAGIYVHERHGTVDYSQGEDKPVFRHRLSGWYGGDQVGRFNMDNRKCSGPPYGISS